MITFIEGPDTAGKNELYEQCKLKLKYTDVIYYDICKDEEVLMLLGVSEDRIINELGIIISTLLKIALENKHLNIISCGGPMLLAEHAFNTNDAHKIMNAYSVLSSGLYQNANMISVSSQYDDKNRREIYRNIGSRNMSIMTDAGKFNNYRIFINKDSDVNRELFLNDVRTLINK